MVAHKQLRFVLVTPEKTLLDEPVNSLRFPLYDGLMGVLPGRAPLVGRLGAGELLFDREAGETSYFIDGGFVQINGEVVTLLTNRAVPANQLSVATSEGLLQEAMSAKAVSDSEIQAKEKAVYRARQMLTLAKKSR